MNALLGLAALLAGISFAGIGLLLLASHTAISQTSYEAAILVGVGLVVTLLAVKQ